MLGGSSVYAQTLYRVSSGTTHTLNAVFFPVDDSGNTGNNGYIVGDSGSVCITSDGGYSWSGLPTGVTTNFYTEYFNDSANGAFAGDDGTIYVVLQDNPPIKVSLPESNPIYSITFPDIDSYDTAIVTGAQGLFYKSVDSGKTWKKIALPAAAQKFDFHGTDYFDNDTYWIVGQDGLVLYTEDGGSTWTRYPVPTVGTPTTKTLYSIYFPDDGSSTGWIVGDQCLFLTTDGGDTWTSISTTDSLRLVAGWDSTDAYAVGLHGQILYTSDRSDWTEYPSGTTANLYGFDFPDSLFFVGDSGLILTTQPPVAQPATFEIVTPLPHFISFQFVKDGGDSTYDGALIANTSNVPLTITKNIG